MNNLKQPLRQRSLSAASRVLARILCAALLLFVADLAHAQDVQEPETPAPEATPKPPPRFEPMPVPGPTPEATPARQPEPKISPFSAPPPAPTPPPFRAPANEWPPRPAPAATPSPAATPAPRPRRTPRPTPSPSPTPAGPTLGEWLFGKSKVVSQQNPLQKDKPEEEKEAVETPYFDEVQIGLSKGLATARAGCWVPVTLVVANDDAPYFDGVLSVSFDGLTPFAQVAEVTLPKKSRKRYEFLVRVPLFDTGIVMPFVAQLVNKDGYAVARVSSERYWLAAKRKQGAKKPKGLEKITLEVGEREQPVALVVSPVGDDPQPRPEAAGYGAYTLPAGIFLGVESRSIFQSPGADPGDPDWFVISSEDPGRAIRRLQVLATNFINEANNARANVRNLREEIDRLKAQGGSISADQEAEIIQHLNNMGLVADAKVAESRALHGIARRANGRRVFSNSREQRLAELFNREAVPLEREIPGGMSPLREFAPSWVADEEDSLSRRTSAFASRFYDEVMQQQIVGFRNGQPLYQRSRQSAYGQIYGQLAGQMNFTQGSLELLPSHPLGYDGVDVVIWQDADPDSLTPAQGQALFQWIRAGGQLIIGGGDKAMWRGSWFEDFAPATLGDGGDKHRFPAAWNETEDPNPWRRLQYQEVSVRDLLPGPKAETIARSDGRVMAVRARVGGGLVTATAYSLWELAAEAGPSVRSDPNFLDLHFPPDAPRADFRVHGANIDPMREAVEGIGGAPLVDVDGAFLLGLGFFAVSVLFNAWLSRKLKKPLLFWFAFAGLSVSATIVIALVFRNSSDSPMETRHFVWLAVDAGSPVARGTSLAAVETRLPALIRPRFGGASSPVAHFTISDPQSYEQIKNLREISGDANPLSLRERRAVWKGAGVPPKLEPVWLGIAESAVFGANYYKDLGGTVEARFVRPEAGGNGVLKLALENKTPHRLVRAVLYEDPNNVYIVGDIPAGASREVALKPEAMHAYGADRTTASVSPNRPFLASDPIRITARGSTSKELAALRGRPELNRMKPWLDELDAAAKPSAKPSVVRALLGMSNENDSVVEDFNVRLRRTANQPAGTPVAEDDAMGLPKSSFYVPADAPADGFVLVAEFEKPAIEFDPGVSGVASEGLQVLAVRIPRSWLTKREGFRLYRAAPEPEAPAATPVEFAPEPAPESESEPESEPADD